MLVQNYANLALDRVTLNGASDTRYVLSNNNGTTLVKNATLNTSEHVALDVYYWPSGSYGKVEVNVVNSTINGKVEYAGDNTTTTETLLANAILTIDAASMTKKEVVAPTGYELENKDGVNQLVQAKSE